MNPWPIITLDPIDGIPDVSRLRRTGIVHPDGRPYLERYHLIDNEHLQVRYHHWLSGDPDRDLHDHPWDNVTMVLAGHLLEVGEYVITELHPGAVITRHATDAHRIELVTDDAWTLFITGRFQRQWGFQTPAGWQDWRHYPHAGRYEQ